MLEMKRLLRQYGVTISLTAPDVHDLLMQAAAAIDDEAISSLRLRLMAAHNPEHNLPSSPKALDQEKPDNDAVKKVYIQGPFVEHEVDVFLEGEETQAPATKRIALNTPRTGLLRCDKCQRTSTVVAAASEEAAREVQCPCGVVYRVIMDARKYDRKLANLPGFYVDQKDEAKTGPLVIENISFGGLRCRITCPHNVVYDDLLGIQFTLDDAAQTRLWEKVRVHYVNHDVVGVEFMELDKFNKNLAAYLMR
jgi:hypothetical protein